ncbi:MAG: hypothetical protein KAS86_00940 [Candidatus Omnitrophica bacterium]|nr:hypothetical protein [Candidatus Omnitrophota bacterium]
MFRRKKSKQFGEIAVKKGLVSQKDLREALKAQKDYLEKHNLHKKIGAILSEKGMLAQDDIEILLEEQKKETSLMAWFCALFSLNR